MTRKEFITKAIDAMSSTYSLGESKAIAIRILTHYLGLSEYEYYMEQNVPIPKSGQTPLLKALDELLEDRPVQYIIGYADFAGHAFNVSEAVLIPRPETEQLCRIITGEWKKSGYTSLRILDACTGSGCIAYTLACSFPKSSVFACDNSPEALEVAMGQKVFIDGQHRQPLENIPVFFQYDILSGVPEDNGSVPNIEDLDILVSNPPYVLESEKEFMKANVLEYEPASALFVPDSDPLRFYRPLAEWAEKLLKTGGRGYFEINEAMSEKVAGLVEGCGFSEVEILDDIHNRHRFVSFTKWF